MEPIAWKSETMRLTIFPSAPFHRRDWWFEILGERADEEKNAPKSGLFQQLGEYKEHNLVISTQPDRIDLIWTAVLRDTFTHPVMGTFHECLSDFSELSKKLISLCPSATRIAFGPVLLSPVVGQQEGYGQLIRLLNLNLDLADASEFLLQINRPRKSSKIDKVKINRLASWSVMKLQKLELQGESVKGYPEEECLYASRLQLDINNAPSMLSNELSVVLMENLFDEFRALAVEISEKGDCK